VSLADTLTSKPTSFVWPRPFWSERPRLVNDIGKTVEKKRRRRHSFVFLKLDSGAPGGSIQLIYLFSPSATCLIVCDCRFSRSAARVDDHVRAPAAHRVIPFWRRASLPWIMEIAHLRRVVRRRFTTQLNIAIWREKRIPSSEMTRDSP